MPVFDRQINETLKDTLMSAFSRQINETPQGCNLMPVFDRQTIETLQDNLYVGLRPTNYRKEDFE